MGVVLTKLRQEPFQRVAFAVVFRFAILLQDRFGHQGDDFLVAGTNQRGTKHLMMVGDRAVTMMFFHASGAMDFVGREILRAVEGQQIAVIQKAKLLQGLTAGQSREDISEGRPEVFWVDRIQDLSHTSITRHVVHAEDHLQVLFVRLSSLVEGQHRRILHSEHGQSAHQRIGQIVASPVLGSATS